MRIISVLNKEALSAAKSVFIGYKQRWIAGIVMAVAILCAIFNGVAGNTEIAVILVLVVLALIVEVLVIQHRSVTITLRRAEELYGSQEVALELNFFEDDYTVLNTRTGGLLSMQYDTLARLWECDAYAVLQTKTKQFHILPLAQFETTREKQEFYDLLRAKAPGIKIKAKG